MLAETLTSGTLLGLAAGFSPGPLTTLVISESLRYGRGAGSRVALAPMVTDLPIVLLALLLVGALTQVGGFLGVVSLLGALFVLHLGWDSWKSQEISLEVGVERPRSLAKGVVANFLSPNPYLFWFSVGAPLVIKTARIDMAAAAAFFGSFYLFLVGGKLSLAALVGHSRHFLTGRAYGTIMRLLGVLLWIFALHLLRQGLHFLGLI